jgi:putative hydrolase of the HAD superfamily
VTAQGLLLDVGVVFFKSAWEIADDYERIRTLPPGTVMGRGPLAPEADVLWQEYLAGRATERDYWLAFADRAVANGAPLDGHPTLMRSMFQTPGIEVVRPQAQGLVDIAERHGKRLGILTNELMDFQGRQWVEAQPWFRQFPVLIDSSELGMRKPNPEPYLIAIEHMSLPADDIVFIDDNPTYVAGGEAVGLQSLLLDVTEPTAVFVEAAARIGLAVEFDEFLNGLTVGK